MEAVKQATVRCKIFVTETFQESLPKGRVEIFAKVADTLHNTITWLLCSSVRLIESLTLDESSVL